MRFIDVVYPLLVLLCALCVLSVCSFAIIFDQSVYESRLSLQAQELNNDIIEYLKGNLQELPKPFNEREQAHMHDVKNIFDAMKSIMVAFMLLVALMLISKKHQVLITTLKHGSIVLIGFLSLLMILIVLTFSSTFEIFHQIFFAQGTYLFDAQSETLTSIYSEEFFAHMAKRIATLSVIISFLVLLGSHCLEKNYKRSTN